MAKTLSEKSLAIREGLSRLPNLNNKELAELLTTEGKVGTVSATDIAQQKVAIRTSRRKAPRAADPHQSAPLILGTTAALWWEPYGGLGADHRRRV